ncbi:MAG: hypothetical protein WAT39_18215 [Planctomycetota bacterium]
MAVHDSPRALAYARARAAARGFVDVYRQRAKLYPAVCRDCGATEWQGRWRWDGPVPGLAPVVCPACERIRDGAAAHVVELTGALDRWWPEVRGLIANVGRAEAGEHPLERVMHVDVRGDRVLVPTTGVHVARRLVAAIVRRWRHGVRLTFADGATRIEWVAAQQA